MPRSLLAALLAALLAVAAAASPAPAVRSPASASPDTALYVVTNHGRVAGHMTVMREGRQIEVVYAHVDRNRGRWAFGRYELDEDGRVVRVEAGPTERDGTFGEVAERIPADRDADDGGEGDDRRGGATAGADEAGGGEGDHMPAFLSRYGTPWETARLARFLLGRPDMAWVTPDGDTLRAEVVATERVDGGPGGGHVDVRLVMVDFGGPAGTGVWLDDAGELFATEVAWFITYRDGAEAALPALRAAEIAVRDARGEAVAREIGARPAGTVVIRGGDVFDARTGRVAPNTTVVIEGDRIAAVGPAGSVDEPAGATVIDADGMTVMPGMWDMHSHSALVSQIAGAPIQLANGLTTVRDLAGDLDVTVPLRDRAADGTIVSPRQVLGGFVEGPGAWAGPTEAIARDEAEARAWVARYDALGYEQIKLYNLIHPDLVPVFAEEARARGMRLSGHVPRGMSVEAAVELGYDEINHAAFLFSTFFPDSLWLPEMRPYSGVAGAVAGGFDVDGPAMTALIDFLAERGTVVDGTFNIWMGGRSYLEREPGAAQRAYGRLLKRLWDGGVTLVPGTDSFDGGSFLTELLLYEAVGIPAPDVLRIATLVPAAVMGDAEDYGTVEVGKVADILVVDGAPHERIGDLERIHRVVRAGRVYDPAAIREALGVDGRQ